MQEQKAKVKVKVRWILIEDPDKRNRDERQRIKVVKVRILLLEIINEIKSQQNLNHIHHQKEDTENIDKEGARAMDHIWTIEDWEKNIDLTKEGHRTGLRMRFDKEVDSEVRRACKEFDAFLRKEYFFPLRVVIYVKKHYRIIALDGDRVCGTFRSTYDDYTVEPYILLAAGDYNDLCKKRGKDNALAAILFAMAHELTHYFQWINSLKLTPIGQERQATKYAGYLLDEYAETRDHP